MPVPLLAVAGGWLASIGGAIVGTVTAIASSITLQSILAGLRWLAMKALFAGLIYVAVPWVLYHVIMEVVIDIAGYAISYVQSTGGLGDMTLEITGMGGWIGQRLRIVECFGVVATGAVMRFVVSVVT